MIQWSEYYMFLIFSFWSSKLYDGVGYFWEPLVGVARSSAAGVGVGVDRISRFFYGFFFTFGSSVISRSRSHCKCSPDLYHKKWERSYSSTDEKVRLSSISSFESRSVSLSNAITRRFTSNNLTQIKVIQQRLQLREKLHRLHHFTNIFPNQSIEVSSHRARDPAERKHPVSAQNSFQVPHHTKQIQPFIATLRRTDYLYPEQRCTNQAQAKNPLHFIMYLPPKRSA